MLTDSETKKIAREVVRLLLPEIRNTVLSELNREQDKVATEESLLSPSEIMDKVGIGKSKFYKISKLLPSVTIPGGHKKYRYSDVVRFMTNYNG